MTQPHESDPGPGPDAMPDAARSVLARVRAAARAFSRNPPTSTPRGSVRSRSRSVGGYSGPGPDERDPVAIRGAWSGVVADEGWGNVLDAAKVHGLWAEIVGVAIAEHAAPESFDPATGVLVVRTASTAWAEQLRLMMPAMRASIDAHVGPGVVKDISITGPNPPPWSHGRLRVAGRGPRDTYG
ncbi:MAG: DciA family protein [Candidatus Nanopelagicales bacterium]